MKYTIALLAACLAPVLAMAEDKVSDSEKIDSIYVMQKQVVRTIKNDPLTNKNFGVEFNVARLLLYQQQFSLSGGLSLFGVDRNVEISLPFYYANSKSEGINDSLLGNINLTEFNQDIHYRYFLGNTQNGFYLSGFARYAYLSGILGNNLLDNLNGGTNPQNVRSTENKLGVGVGIGYRIFSYKGLYWGCSASVGRYVIGESDKFRGGFLSLDSDEKYIFDVELLKFGYAF